MFCSYRCGVGDEGIETVRVLRVLVGAKVNLRALEVLFMCLKGVLIALRGIGRKGEILSEFSLEKVYFKGKVTIVPPAYWNFEKKELNLSWYGNFQKICKTKKNFNAVRVNPEITWFFATKFLDVPLRTEKSVNFSFLTPLKNIISGDSLNINWIHTSIHPSSKSTHWFHLL